MKSKIISKLPYITNKAISLIRNDLPVFSFFASSSIASFRNIVINHKLNTSAWTIFLQSSLILSIWNNFDYFKKQSMKDYYKSNITILIAFLFGSIGSIIGSIFGYYTSILYIKLTSNNALLISHTSLQLKLIASCICSSYIGGSANYFETAELLTSKLMTIKLTTNTILLKNGLNAVAGIDIAIMVLYFTVISSIQSAASRRRPNNKVSGMDTDKSIATLNDSGSNKLSTNSTIIAPQDDTTITSATSSTSTTVTASTAESDPTTTSDLKEPNQTSKTTSSPLLSSSLFNLNTSQIRHYIRHILTSSLTYIFPLTSAVCICYISQYIQTNILTTPGISVLCSTILSLLTASFYSVFSHYFTNRTQFNLSVYTVSLDVACGNLSSSMLTAFYILIGKLYVCILI